MIRLRIAETLVVVLATAAVALGEDGPSEGEVAGAIARGVSALKQQQQPDGSWSYTFNQGHTLGITALVGLALLENGVDRADPVIASAHEAVRTLAPRSDQTYDLALAILFLARVRPDSRGSNDPLIQRLATRLEGGEQGGTWSYNVPMRSEDRPRRLRGSSARRRAGRGDHSNTQFALLGIWAAGRHGFDPNEALEAIDAHFRESQGGDGRWGYIAGAAGSEAMTCAGLMGLAISAARPSLAERQTARARGAALAADPAFALALKAVKNDARSIGPRTEIYYLWSLERVCVALGLRSLDGFDWYAAGARELLGRQRPDGAWPDGTWGALPHTCLALLFLRKANLAFELDRVLKLPGAPRPAGGAEAAADGAKAPNAPGLPGQGPAAGDDAKGDVVITAASEAKFPEISVDFEVKRPDGTFQLDALADDFRITEYDQAVPILRLEAPRATESRPTTVVLVVDRSRSMEEEDRMGALKKAVASFLDRLPKGSRVAVVAFGSEVKTVCPFTDEPRKVREAVAALTPGGATRYYDAVAEALEMLHKETGRRAVLALTDGEDTFSQSATPDAIVASARRLGLPIHTLGLGSEDEIESDALRRVASQTRGQYYPARQADQLRTIYEQLAERLRSSYTLVYRSERKLPDGTLRPIRIYYKASRKAAEVAVFVRGMVVPVAGWPRLFLALVGGLATLALLPGWLSRRRRTRVQPQP